MKLTSKYIIGEGEGGTWVVPFCPKDAVGLFGLDDEILPDTRDEHAYIGDPVKNTMVMQVLRRLPLLTTIPWCSP